MFKLKNFKLFESKNLFMDSYDKIKSEIDSVSYILEDEKMKVGVFHFNGDSGLFEGNGMLIKIEHLNALMNHGGYSWLEKYDWFIEWLDRVEEIISNHGFKINKFNNNTFIIILSKDKFQ